MNLVRLQYGGSSIEPYTVIVSLDEKFKGQPVTLTQGIEIMRNTCPMTSPYVVEFKPMNDGVWVASSTTKDGKVVSVDTEPLLEWGTYNVTLESGFNFREWLNRGRVKKTFTSLDDVLADQPTVRQLMTVHDSVDYLVTALSNDAYTAKKILDNDICAKWINLRDYALDMLYANANVKAVMDSVDKYGYGEWALIDGTWQPKGAVPVMTANNAPYGEASNYQVFDGNATTSASDTNFSYRFENPICVKKMVSNASGGTLQVSDDGINWIADDGGYHLYARCHYSASTSVNTLQFYGRQLKVSVPKMDNYTTPFGEVIELGYAAGGYEGYRAFDNDLSTYWQSNTDYIGMICYNFEKEVLVKNMYSIMKTPNTGVSKLEGSNTGNSNDWHSIYNDNITAGYPNTKSVLINGNLTYKYYRATITRTDDVPQVTELQFYGLDYSEREFAENSKVEYIYDHGVKLKTIETSISNGGTIDEQSDQILWSTNNKNGVTMLGAKVDITGKKVARARFGLQAYTNSPDENMGFMILNNTLAWNTPFNAVKAADMPNNANVNFASGGYSGEYYVIFGADFTGAFNIYNTLQELWVE